MSRIMLAVVAVAVGGIVPAGARTPGPGVRAAIAASVFQVQADPGLTAATARLRQALNDFCVSMHRTYNDETVEFYDAYREAYELLQVAKKAEAVAAAGGSSRRIGKAIADIAGEIDHVEHHLGEFAERPGLGEAERWRVAAKFEAVETALQELAARLGVSSEHAHGGHEHDHEHEQGEHGHAPEGHEHGDADEAGVRSVDPARLAAVTATVRSRMNGFCVTLYRAYNDQSPTFKEAYAESFELLQTAKKADAIARSGGPPDAVADALTQFDGEVHHVEHHLSELAEARAAASLPLDEEVAGAFDAVETALHDALALLGVKEKHVDADERDEEAEALAARHDAARLARDLAGAANSLWRAMEHNYAENPDFREAHDEAAELRQTCLRIETLIRGEEIEPEGRDLISGLDGEIHHLAEHIDGFVPDDADQKAGAGRAKRKLEDVELLLHALMKRTGIEKRHVD